MQAEAVHRAAVEFQAVRRVHAVANVYVGIGLRKRGHSLWINSGRTRAFIREKKLFDLGFDGVVSGCGTMIEYGDGKKLMEEKIQKDTIRFLYEIPQEEAARMRALFRQYGIRALFEGKEKLYVNPADFEGDRYIDKVRQEMGEDMLLLDQSTGSWEISKFACDARGGDRDGCCAVLKDHYNLLLHTGTVFEIVPAPYSKATGLAAACAMAGIDIADTMAFGDGVNDIEMLKCAGVGVAMGGGQAAAREAADYVTAPLEEEGILKALEHFELI